MAALRAKSRLQVGSAPWITEERASALQMISSEAEEFSFSAKNELDWLNEHMAQIFDENQLNVTELFKTPGKLRGKTPRVARKNNPLEARAPLSDVFSATPHGPGPNPFRKQQAVRQAPKFSVAEDASEPPKQKPPPLKSTSTEITNFDSGYHGSQASIATDVVEQSPQQVPHPSTAKSHLEPLQPLDVARQSDDRRTTEESFQSAKEDQTVNVAVDGNALGMIQTVATEALMTSASRSFEDPVKSLEIASSPRKPTSPGLERRQSKVKIDSEPTSNQAFEDIQSPSDGSSPVRPIRHSSLSFATLPPREPLNTNAKKSIGNRTSRTSHLDRTSYYGRNTGGKSLGSRQVEDVQDEEDSNLDLNLPEISKPESDRESKMTRMHNKTSTQRLQDQISMLGKSQSNVPRPSKSIPSIVAAASQKESQHVSPARHDPVVSAPGAFPAEEDDDWIEPQTQSNAAPAIFSPRPELTKSHTLAVMDSVHDQDDASVFAVPKQRSPVRDPVERTVSPLGLTKYASTSVITSPSKRKEDYSWYLKKGVSVSNPNLASHSGRGERSPSKSPSRSLRDSPLKAAKDKISSILKTSRSLFASSAAVSADAHCSTLSGPSTRSAQDPARDSIQDHATNDGSLYPSLDAHQQPDSPSKSGIARRTRASTEREERRKEKEAKEARMMNEQLEKLEKLREKESQKARVFSQEQERVISMKKQIAVQKEQEKHGKPATVESPRATRSSPRKVKGQLETEGKIAVVSVAEKSDRDVNMVDAPKDMPPPAVPRPASQMSKISKDHSKRVAKPGVHPPTRGPKTAPAPVHIKVHTGVHGGPHRNPLHPSNTALASSLGDSLAPAASKSNATGPSLSHKVSTSSMKSTVSTSSATKKPAALAAAARKKEQDEREAQRRRDLNLENQRKRAALEEERRQEQQRLEAEKRRDKQRGQAEASKNAQRQILERAKLERPPPPAVRPLTGNNSEYHMAQDKPLPPAPPHRGDLGAPRPPRMNSTIHRPVDDNGRMGNPSGQNMAKAPLKRPLPLDTSDEASRPALQRNGPSYAGKRRRTEEQNVEVAEAPPRPAMAPPVRQSAVRPPKDGPSKSIFASGYANVPQASHGAPTLLQQATRPQQGHQQKPAHPMDMTHNSKATINFAPNTAQASGPHKTPARPVVTANGKSTAKASTKSSPHYQNGDSIDLPEINTDSEDEDSDAGGNDFAVPDWANSPNLAPGLIAQEGVDPVSVFGRPGELRMEEVFRNKERWGRFRQRTSSANWSGSDRLTEEEVRRDLEARERLRREGGWSYGLS